MKRPKKKIPTASSCPCRYHPPLQRRGLFRVLNRENVDQKQQFFLPTGPLEKLTVYKRKRNLLKEEFSPLYVGSGFSSSDTYLNSPHKQYTEVLRGWDVLADCASRSARPPKDAAQ